MLHKWIPETIYFGVKRSKIKVTSHKNTACVWIFALLWVLASSGYRKLFKHTDTHTAADWLHDLDYRVVGNYGRG